MFLAFCVPWFQEITYLFVLVWYSTLTISAIVVKIGLGKHKHVKQEYYGMYNFKIFMSVTFALLMSLYEVLIIEYAIVGFTL